MAESGENLPINDGSNLPMRTERPLETGQNPITHSEQAAVDHALAKARERVANLERDYQEHPEKYPVRPIVGGSNQFPGQERLGGRPLTEAERLMYESQAREAGRGSWFAEGLRKTENPLALRYLNRGILAAWEKFPRQFSEFTALHYLGILQDRAAGYEALRDMPLEVAIELGLVDHTSDDGNSVERGLFHTELNPVQIRKIAEETVAARDEFIARTTILEVYKQQGQMAGDLKQYGFQFFIAPWRVKTEARHYADIGRSGETLPGKEKFGVLVDEAMRGWIDLAEGKETDLHGTKIGIPQDEQGKIGNPFDGDLYESKLERQRKWIADHKTRGDRQAVQTAWLLLRHMDVHVSYAMNGGRLIDLKKPSVGRRMQEILSAIGKFDSRDYLAPPYKRLCLDRGDLNEIMGAPDDTDISLDTVGDVAVEASDTTNDTAKANYIAVRQLAEFTKDNPRAVAAPATIGCFPNLTTDMMRMISFGDTNMWDLWRKHGIRFGDFPWDESSEADTDKHIGWQNPADGKYYKGIAKVFHHVPYGLQAMYALGKVYESIMNDDFAKMGEQIMDPSYLHGLNKAYELTFSIMWGKSVNLVSDAEIERDPSKDTLKKLRQLAKVNMLAGIIIANTTSNTNDPQNIVERMGMPMVAYDLISKSIRHNRKTYTQNVVNNATTAGFLSIRDHEEGKKAINGKSLYSAEKALITAIVENRRMGVKPSLLEGEWFSLEEINRMNLLGIYAPFKA